MGPGPQVAGPVLPGQPRGRVGSEGGVSMQKFYWKGPGGEGGQQGAYSEGGQGGYMEGQGQLYDYPRYHRLQGGQYKVKRIVRPHIVSISAV